MSANYYVKVQSIVNDTITFKIFLADDSFANFADSSFALRLLCSPDDAYKYNEDGDMVPNCPLAKEINLENYLDENWIDNNAHHYIADLKLVSLNNFPYEEWDYDRWSGPTKLNSDNEPDFSAFAEDHPGGILSIKVFNPRHLDHFSEGMTFATAAYSTDNMRQIHYDSVGIWMYSE